MTQRWSRSWVATASVAVLIAVVVLAGSAVAGGVAPPAVTPAPPPAFDAAFSRLYGDLTAEPSFQVNVVVRFALAITARQAEHEANHGAVCRGVSDIAHLETTFDHLVREAAQLFDWRITSTEQNVIDTDLLAIRAGLLADPRSAACGGATTAATTAPTPITTVGSSDNTGLSLHIALPAVQFTTKVGDGSPFTAISEPGTGDVSGLLSPPSPSGAAQGSVPSAIGRPDLPGFSEQIAVPEGQSVSVAVTNTTGYLLPAVQLWPLQPSAAADTTGGNGPPPPLGLTPPPPFTIDPSAYRSTSAYPAELGGAGEIGSTHGLATATIALAGAQYVASSRSLRVLTSEDVRITFSGSSANRFGDANLLSPRSAPFQTVWANQLVNYRTVGSYLGGLLQPGLCGEDMIVITSSSLEPAAAQFAADRTAHGVLARVFTTDGPGGIGTTPVAIRNFIASRYHLRGCPLLPNYVTLVGDIGQVPTFEESLGFHLDSSSNLQPNFYEDPIATDVPYGFIHQAAQVDAGNITDFGQDLFVGRVPASSNAQASAVLTGITNQEDSPPAATAAFYRNVVGAEFFQPCPIQTNCLDSHGHSDASTQDTESFLRTSEFVGTEAAIAGKTFDRVAGDEGNYDPVAIDPQTYDTGAPLPSGINWNGDATDIANAVNSGAFLVWHSDHGATNGLGWYEPPFNENDNGTNDLFLLHPPASELPVIWSSDCDTGKFDEPNFPFVANATTDFGVASIENQEAVAFVGASRESPIYQDGFMLQGMGSSLFPEEGNLLLALFGVTPRPAVTQLGPLLDAAKSYMVAETSADLVNDTGARGTLLEYNDLGDPSMSVLRDAPARFDTSSLSIAQTGITSVLVESFQNGIDGTVVSLLSNGNYIGQGVLENGELSIDTDVSLQDLQGVQAVLAKPGFVPIAVNLPFRP